MVKARNEISVNLPVQACDSAALDINEELPVSYIELDTAGLVIRANRVARSLYPHEHGKFIGKILWDFMPAAEKESSRAAFFKIMESAEVPPPVRRTVYTSAGDFRTFELHRSLMRDAEGRPMGIRMVSFDVTETEAAHEEASQARQWLESVLASIAEAVVVTDALGFISYINSATEELTGRKAGELIGKLVEEGIPLLTYTSTKDDLLSPRIQPLADSLHLAHITGNRVSPSHRTSLVKRTRGIATILDGERRKVRIEISTSPLVDKENGFTTGVVSVLRQVEDPG